MRALVAAVFCLPIVGCIKLASNDPVAFCIEEYKIRCGFAHQCCTELDERAFFSDVLSRNESECVEIGTHLCEGLSNDLQISVERGRAAVNGEVVSACLQDQREAKDSCDLKAYRTSSSGCYDVVDGLVEDGDPCVNDDECAEDHACVIEYGDDGYPKDYDEEIAVPQGECQARADEGENCADRGCKQGLSCTLATVDYVCTALPRRGEPCPNFEECAEGLSCRGDTRTCERLSANGEACFVNPNCLSGYCNDDELCAPAPASEDCRGP